MFKIKFQKAPNRKEEIEKKAKSKKSQEVLPLRETGWKQNVTTTRHVKRVDSINFPFKKMRISQNIRLLKILETQFWNETKKN